MIFLFFLRLLGVYSLPDPITLSNYTVQTMSSGNVGSYFYYNYTITPDMVPINVNIQLEGNNGADQGVLYASINSSISCQYNEYPDGNNNCYSSGYGNQHSVISLNFLKGDVIAISAYISTYSSNFKIKILAYPLLMVTNGSNIDINSLDSAYAYTNFNRYFQYYHNQNLIENIYFILEGKSATDTGSLFLSLNCTNRIFNWFPSSSSNYVGSSYSDKAIFVPINQDNTASCLISIAVYIATYSQGFNLRVISYPLTPLTNNTVLQIDSLQSPIHNYKSYYRYYSYTSKNNESPGSLHIIVNGVSSSDSVKIYAKSACMTSCLFSYFPDSLNNCWATLYSNPYQVLTVTLDAPGCFISIAVLVDSYNQGISLNSYVYPSINLRNNTYVSIAPINPSATIPFWRYFNFQAKIVGSLNILLEGIGVTDIGGIYADTDCVTGCAFSNFPSKLSSCYRKYEARNSFVTINLYSTCNIAIGIYISTIPTGMNIKVILYPQFPLPNGVSVLIDAYGSKAGYELFYRYYTFILKDTDAMGNLTITLTGLSNGDPGQLYVSTNCQADCSFNNYPFSSTYCYQTTYGTSSQVQIYLQSACTISIAAYISSYSLGSMIKAYYYNICHQKIPLCSTCNISSDGVTTLCNGCDNYYAANPVDHLSCQFCNITLGYFVDLNNGGYCTKCQNNCFNCTDINTCIQCNQGYISTQISGQQTTCVCSVSNCVNCLSGGICSSCQYGYGLYSMQNLCIPCLIDNCSVCSYNASYYAHCDQCSNGLIFKDGFCKNCSDVVGNCSVCNDSSTCLQCKQGFYLNQKSKCNSCGDSNTFGCTACSSDFTCTGCLAGNYLADNQSCVPCADLYGNCSLCDIQNCIHCSVGYYFNTITAACTLCGINNCYECSFDGSTCSICDPGFSLMNGSCIDCNAASTNLSNCTTCELITYPQITWICKACMPSFYLDVDGTCQSCLPNSASCLTCDNILNCTSCENDVSTHTYLYPNINGSTCVASCPITTILYNNSGVCDSCEQVFGHGCVNCNAVSCLKCGTNEPYLYGNSCSVCNGTHQTVVNQTYCFDNPNITFFNVINVGFLVNIQINCSVYSRVFFAYGLLNAIDNLALSSISYIRGFVPTNDTIYDWKGYGSVKTDNYGFLNITINGPFKNNGQMYKMKSWCQVNSSWGTMQSLEILANWTQVSNGAKVVKIYINSSSYISYDKKPLIAEAIQQTISLSRGVYTENGIPALNYIASRILLDNNFNYNYSFYIVPDYKITYDYMEAVINSSLQNSTLFALNIQSYVRKLDPLSTITLTGVGFIGTFDNNAAYQAIIAGYPIFSVRNQTILIQYLLKEDGTFYVGVKKYDSTDNIYTVSSTGVVNTTISWSLLKNSLDYNSNPLKFYQAYSSVANVLQTVNLSTLDANTNYFIFYGAGNTGIPENVTNIGIQSVITGWLNNQTNTTTSARKILVNFVLVFGLLFGCLIYSL